MAVEYQATSTPTVGRLEDRLAHTVRVLRARRVRLARLGERARTGPGEQDFIEIIDAATAVEATTARACRLQDELRRARHAG